MGNLPPYLPDTVNYNHGKQQANKPDSSLEVKPYLVTQQCVDES